MKMRDRHHAGTAADDASDIWLFGTEMRDAWIRQYRAADIFSTAATQMCGGSTFTLGVADAISAS